MAVTGQWHRQVACVRVADADRVRLLCAMQQKNISQIAGTAEGPGCSTTRTNSNAAPFPGYQPGNWTTPPGPPAPDVGSAGASWAALIEPPDFPLRLRPRHCMLALKLSSSLHAQSDCHSRSCKALHLLYRRLHAHRVRQPLPLQQRQRQQQQQQWKRVLALACLLTLALLAVVGLASAWLWQLPWRPGLGRWSPMSLFHCAPSCLGVAAEVQARVLRMIARGRNAWPGRTGRVLHVCVLLLGSSGKVQLGVCSGGQCVCLGYHLLLRRVLGTCCILSTSTQGCCQPHGVGRKHVLSPTNFICADAREHPQEPQGIAELQDLQARKLSVGVAVCRTGWCAQCRGPAILWGGH
jgi:hypothetical protein